MPVGQDNQTRGQKNTATCFGDGQGYDLAGLSQGFREAHVERGEGLDVRGAFLHDLDQKQRQEVDISPNSLDAALKIVVDAAAGIKNREFEPNPEKSRCSRCDVRAFCPKIAK